MKPIRLLGAFAGLVVFACGTAWSQPYPSKPVRVVVVFPAGGATDITARIVFQKVGEQLKQQFVIDNRAGAAGMIGAEIVMKSPPDGYTLMVYSQTFLANAHLYQKVVYDPLKDFEYTISVRSEEHTSELQSLRHLVCRRLLGKKNSTNE